MLKDVIFVVALSISIIIFYSQIKSQSMNMKKEIFQPLSYESADKKADSVLALMTQDEKIAMVEGDRSFFIRSIPRLNLPEVYMTDATQGVHLREKFSGIDLTKYQLEKSTAFPCPIYFHISMQKR
jgi:uncharacterized protein YpmB